MTKKIVTQNNNEPRKIWKKQQEINTLLIGQHIVKANNTGWIEQSENFGKIQ